MVYTRILYSNTVGRVQNLKVFCFWSFNKLLQRRNQNMKSRDTKTGPRFANPSYTTQLKTSAGEGWSGHWQLNSTTRERWDSSLYSRADYKRNAFIITTILYQATYICDVIRDMQNFVQSIIISHGYSCWQLVSNRAWLTVAVLLNRLQKLL